ncbi:MAG: YncE family protein [Steroidobacteraceae bacterium]
MHQLRESPLRMVYFDRNGRHLLDYALESYRRGLAGQKLIFGYEPEDEVVVLLQDFSDAGNATTVLGAPRNRIFMNLAPPGLSFETFSTAPIVPTIANHELVHLATSDRPSSRDRLFRRMFLGKVAPVPEHPESILYYYLTNPRASVPRWYLEGAGVFFETWMAGGRGRAQGGYDEMVFRSMVRDEASFYDPLSLVSKGDAVDFQAGANAYLYGTRFLSFLVERHGVESLRDWLTRDDDSLAYYAQDFSRVYGRSIEQAWSEWVEWERGFQGENLERVRQYSPTIGRRLAQEGLGAVSRAYLTPDHSRLLAAVRYPGKVPSIIELSLADGTSREIAEVVGSAGYNVASLAYDPDRGILYYTNDNNSYRTLMAVAVDGGAPRQLLKSARIGDLAFDRSDGSLWGLRYGNGFVTLVNLPMPYTEWQVVHVFPFGEIASDLDLSPDGKMLAMTVLGRASGGGTQRAVLKVFKRESLLAGDAKPLSEFDFGVALPESFVFSDDGRYLYGSSYYTGVSNLFRFEVSSGDLEALSNAEIGLFRPLPLGSERLVAFEYSAEGFVPVELPLRTHDDLGAIEFLGARIRASNPLLGDWVINPPSARSTHPAADKLERYVPLRELALEAAYPMVEGYKDSVAAGFNFRFSDPVGIDTASLSVSWSPDPDLPGDERLHLVGQLRSGLWRLTGKYNGGDFYDLFGPTKRAREGYSLRIDYQRPLVFEPPRTLYLNGFAGHYGGLNALPDFQNVAAPDELSVVGLSLNSRNVRYSVGAVDEEKGHSWSLSSQVSYAQSIWTPGMRASLDLGTQLPWKNSSIWWRNAVGVQGGDRERPLANLYLGGFGNNYVDNGSVKAYRSASAMPGFALNALGGQSYLKSMLEVNLPPLRFETIGTPGLYPSWLRSSIFATGLVLEPVDGKYRSTAGNLGFQVDMQLNVLHRLPMTLSAGVARGFGGEGRGETEWMLSLKVL